MREARRAAIGIEALTAVGDLRRYEPAVASVVLLGIVPDSKRRAALTAFSRLPFVLRSEHDDDHSITVSTERGDLTLHLASPDQAGTAMVWHTGSRRHVDLLQARASALGLELADGRLTNRGGKIIRCLTESDLYRRLDLPYIAPELRAGADEIAAAERGDLPALVLELNIRGDLHMHTTWSDGRDTTENMVLTAKQLGYEYVAITDHSQRAWSSRKLSVDDVPRQREEIEALRDTIPGIEILHGIEVDMLTDGSLDFEDEILEGFDIVLASLHVDGGQDRAQLTERYLRAIHHPLVNVITHPANRSPARSPGFDVDFDALFAAASETGTAMEIDGAPGHLDMDGALARRAAAAGVTVAIDSDCHRAEWLARQMRFGVGTARRGWIEPRHVLNAGGVDDVRAFVSRKRAGAMASQAPGGADPIERRGSFGAAICHRRLHRRHAGLLGVHADAAARRRPRRHGRFPGRGAVAGRQRAAGLSALLRAGAAVCPRGERRQSRARPQPLLRHLRRRRRWPADVPLCRDHRNRWRPALPPVCCWRFPTRSGARRSSRRSTRCT